MPDRNRLDAGETRDAADTEEALRQALADRERALDAIHRMAEAVARAGDIQDIYDRALDGITEALGIQRAALLLFDPDGVVRFMAWRGLSDRYRRAAEGHSPWPATARHPEPIFVPDITTDEALGPLRDKILAEGIRALGFVPLVYGGRLLGKFMIYYDRPHEFRPDEVRLVKTIAAHIAVAIGERQLEEAARAREEANRFLAEAGAVLSSSLNYWEALDNLTDLVVRHMADWCVIYVQEDDGLIHRVAGRHTDPAKTDLLREFMAETIDPDSDAPVARVLRTGRAILLEEVSPESIELMADGDPKMERPIRELGMTSAIAVPLTARGRAVGAFTVISADPDRRYGQEDLQLVEDLAHRAAIAVDNARLYEDVLAANQVKSDFLAVMSHELRTPLTAIIGYADLLAAGIGGELTPQQRQQLDRLIASARNLLRLIDEILIYSRTEVGREVVRPETVDIRDLVKEAARRIEPIAREQGLDLEVDIPADPVYASVDPAKVGQILFGLLSNAVKFTEKGKIRISAHGTDDRAVFHVTDTGIGIREEDRERIFDPFWQVEPATTRRRGGAGLGLSLARRLARLMGGDIVVSSEPGRGSTFEVWLPTGEVER